MFEFQIKSGLADYLFSYLPVFPWPVSSYDADLQTLKLKVKDGGSTLLNEYVYWLINENIQMRYFLHKCTNEILHWFQIDKWYTLYLYFASWNSPVESLHSLVYRQRLWFGTWIWSLWIKFFKTLSWAKVLSVSFYVSRYTYRNKDWIVLNWIV